MRVEKVKKGGREGTYQKASSSETTVSKADTIKFIDYDWSNTNDEGIKHRQ